LFNAGDREDDDDGEPSLAVPEVPHWQSQERVWAAACRSRLRDAELEPNLGPDFRERHSQDGSGYGFGNPATDELEQDLDTEEGDELDIHGERDLSSTECINQEHISQNYSWVTDGEMSLATTENIDQRWASFSGSRTDREVDGFAYDEPRRKAVTERPGEASKRVERQLRERRRDEPAENIVELARWRR
jgi:hypothetical protein